MQEMDIPFYILYKQPPIAVLYLAILQEKRGIWLDLKPINYPANFPEY